MSINGREPCEVCKGDGVVARTGDEIDVDNHPIVSRTPTLCYSCGGLGHVPAAEARRRAIAAARTAAG